MNFSARSLQKELLDQEGIPFSDIQQNMRELNTINSLLGGHAITVYGVQQLMKPKQQLHICEIGCGGGDNLAAISQWARKQKLPVTLTGIDLKKACIDVAKEHPVLGKEGKWIVSDYAAVAFEEKPDILFSSLFCHHFSDKQLVKQLQWMYQNCRLGFFINDLERNPLAYYSIKILTSLFSSSYLVKNDAPLSVARGFKKREWELLFAEAGLQPPQIHWKWAFRHLILSQKISSEQ